MKRIITLFMILVMFKEGSIAFAQVNVVSGSITSAGNGQPVPGATVRVKGGTSGAVANEEGRFTISASGNSVLVVSSSGYKEQEVPVNNRTTIDIVLESLSRELEQVVLVGTRRPGRIRTETAVPVDVINMATNALPTGRMDVTSVLNYAAPSFNYNKQSGSDGADHVDLATLRGLGPDQTLVLINGKRRHQTSFVSVFGTRGRGNSGTDLNAISASSIDRVEILRDGASAQYGSDAIAGVINIVLKKDINKLTGNIGASAFYDPKFNTAFKNGLGYYPYDSKLDGRSFTAGLNYGFPVGKNGGFINLSADYLTNGKTFRQALDTTSDPVANPNKMVLNPYRRANGDASLEMGSTMFNAELPFKGGTTFYSFGGANFKSSDAFAFTRNFPSNPERFPTNANNELIEYPGIIMKDFNDESYYNPHIQTRIRDLSWAAGLRGKTRGDWNWDVSNTIGQNRFHFFGDQTFNASLGTGQTHFDDGGFTFLQNTLNANFSKSIAGIAKGFNLAFGAEHRYERYSIFAGEEASYRNFNPTKIVRYDDDTNEPIYVAGGAQGFPGYQPADEVKASRNNVGAYVDAELDVTDKWLLTGAVRAENYSDFGFTHNYKLSTRYKVAPALNVRGSVSTGFRAPSLQQINFSSTFTTVQGSSIAEVKIAPNYSPITKAAGIQELTQERSLNGSVGFTYTPIREFSITVDGYWVRIKDRVVLSGQFSADNADLDPFLASEMNRLRVGLAQFFANAVNTTNRGVDIVMDYNRRAGNNRYRMLFAGNVQKMTIDQINVPAKLAGSEELRQTFLSDREQSFILASAPPSKLTLNLEYGYKAFAIGSRFTRFGTMKILGYGQDALGINPQVPTDIDENVLVKDEYTYSAKIVTDLYSSFQINKNLTLYLGADNVFNVHPDFGVAPGARWWAYNNEPAGPWDAVQMGGNGRRFFTRLSFNF